MVTLRLRGFVLASALLLVAAQARTPEVRGGVSGRVTFSGTVPAPEPINMSDEQYCADAHRAAPALHRRVRVGAQSGLADVIVHVKGVPAGAARPVPTEPAVLDQQGCMYQPAVLALRAGQPLVIRNSDAVLHNVHARPAKNPAFNVGQPVAGMEARRTLRVAEMPIPVRCDIHEWMEASMAVFEDSFYAVSDADGRFTIDGLPAGEYEIEAWHPKLGLKTQKVRVTADGRSEVNIAF